jgi:hypothetical protein
MAEIKHQFDGIAKFNATLIFTALAANPPTAFLTTGVLGKVLFFILAKLGNIMANNGLALANIGVDMVQLAIQKNNYDSAMDAAIKQVLETKGPLSKEQKDAINAPVKEAFLKFISFV